ncbi:MAG: UDP-N-acetylglucosamine 1-carboxyvinyltransferase [Nitrospirota bacterium]
MDLIAVQGGRRLVGDIPISGAKNAALPLLASALLSDEEYVLTNVPNLRDVNTTLKLLRHLGASAQADGAGDVSVTAGAISSADAPYELVKTMRASILVLGPLVARCGEARVSLPGGCAIGARPVNLHLSGLERMGAEVAIEHGYVRVKAGRLRGARVALDLPTVTGTENLLMAATLAEGTTTIEHAAREPEIVDLANALVARGAKIRGAGTDTITVDGVASLRGGRYRVMPDRIETGTYLAAAAITGGDVFLRGGVGAHLESVLAKLREAGADVRSEADGLRVARRGPLRGVDVTTAPYPGFPTDMQAQMMALLSVADGASVLTETVFENRMTHVAELQRMGASIRVEGNHAVVRGVPRLSGAPVMASDLRASACLVVAGLAAEGETMISRVYHLDRGYERMEEKLTRVGAVIRRVREAA